MYDSLCISPLLTYAADGGICLDFTIKERMTIYYLLLLKPMQKNMMAVLVCFNQLEILLFSAFIAIFDTFINYEHVTMNFINEHFHAIAEARRTKASHFANKINGRSS